MDESVAAALCRALGASVVLEDRRARELHSVDALNPARAFSVPSSTWHVPSVVVTPTTTKEVAQTVRLAREYHTPIVPFGGGTGVMGAAVSVAGGIVVDLKRLNKLRSVSVQDRVVWAEAGVILKDMEEALNRQGLMLGHDPWSVPIATVGGAISTNGVGYRAAKYGPMGAQVLGLEVVLPTGDVLRTKAVPKYALGPNLTQLFVGAEGTLGIITAAALRVFRLPEERRFATVAFGDFEAGFQAVSELFALGLHPALMDLTEEASEGSGTDAVLLYLGFEGYREEVEAQQRRTLQVCGEHGGDDIGPQETEKYWRERHDTALRYQRDVQPLPPKERWSRSGHRGASGGRDYLHVALPISEVLAFRRQATAIGWEHGVEVREYAVWTEPELFSMIMVGTALEGNPGEDRFAEAVDSVLRLAQDMGGTMEYCHGVGLKLVHLVEREWGSGLEVARGIKRALDPDGIMNPGKLGL